MAIGGSTLGTISPAFADDMSDDQFQRRYCLQWGESDRRAAPEKFHPLTLA
jgi:hypothetical protein